MCKMINQYAEKIKGSFSFFDRMIINGYIRPFFFDYERTFALSKLGVLYKDFKPYVMGITDSIKSQIEDGAIELGRPVQYLSSTKTNKESIARSILENDKIDEGLICVLKTMECCQTAKVFGSDEGKLVLKSTSTKCLHYYLYYLDKEFGFMFVKIQTWFPFNIQIYINGREFMKSIFNKNDISFQCYDNSFTDISDVAKAQELADNFDSAKLCRRLDHFARIINPFLDTVEKEFGRGYFWCVNQCEYATDIMFKNREDLEDIYPSLVDHAFSSLLCTDIFSFLGRKLSPQFQGEAVSDFKKRPIGYRVKFKLNSDSIKMYDKYSVLRIEVTINNPREFKVFGTVHHNDGTESQQWKPMGKSIQNLYRYAEVSKAANQRFLDAMVDIIPVKSTIDKIDKVSSSKTVGGKRVTAFNLWNPETVSLMEIICDGRFLIKGFRNKDIASSLFPKIEDSHKRSSKTSRLLRKLRDHGLIKKVPKSRRYHVTSNGRQIMGSLLDIRQRTFPDAVAHTNI